MQINDQISIKSYLDRLDFEDAFIKEVYYRSPTYVFEKGIAVPDCPGDMHALVGVNNDRMHSVEFCFHQVTEVSFTFCIDLYPSFIDDIDGFVKFSFSGSDIEYIRCRSLTVRELDVETLGNSAYYGNDC